MSESKYPVNDIIQKTDLLVEKIYKEGATKSLTHDQKESLRKIVPSSDALIRAGTTGFDIMTSARNIVASDVFPDDKEAAIAHAIVAGKERVTRAGTDRIREKAIQHCILSSISPGAKARCYMHDLETKGSREASKFPGFNANEREMVERVMAGLKEDKILTTNRDGSLILPEANKNILEDYITQGLTALNSGTSLKYDAIKEAVNAKKSEHHYKSRASAGAGRPPSRDHATKSTEETVSAPVKKGFFARLWNRIRCGINPPKKPVTVFDVETFKKTKQSKSGVPSPTLSQAHSKSSNKSMSI